MIYNHLTTHHLKKSVRGFTLVELMVTIAVFTTVMTIATGALFSAQAINTRMQETQMILDEINLSVQIVSRDIRYGFVFYCTNDPADQAALITGARKSCAYPTGSTALVFKPSLALVGTTDVSKDRVVYFISNGALFKTEYPYGASPQTYQITSQDIRINTLTFYVSGAESSSVDFDQPFVTFSVAGVTLPRMSNVKPVAFSMQVSVSPRNLDN